ncbi:MAG: M20/M25/M40 family metallo-hydrolase, partial [Myxococcales bacterium]|nr:M20/M25/M40 family metallo-hydrolase [Myxococcales bacterium]
MPRVASLVGFTRVARSLVVGVGLVATACGPARTAGPAPVDPTPVELAAGDDDGAIDTASEPAPPAAPATPIADAYRDVAAQILTRARGLDGDGGGAGAWAKLAYLTDRIGNRLSGTKALDRAIAWATQAMKDDGHDVRTEQVMVPRWIRGAESVTLTAPEPRDVVAIGLGGTVATPKGGVTAPVVVVTSWEDLEARKDQIAGKIVLYDVPMPAWTEADGNGYGAVVKYRWAGATAAAKHGAVGMMIRSVTEHGMRLAHTGSMGYDDKVKKIPAVAISVEDAAMIHRLTDAGEQVTAKIVTSGKFAADVASANVIGELRGREHPEQVVVLAAHLDSWDVGQGAHDDGAGCAAIMQALTVLRELGLQPRRTIRVVLYTNEENGVRGGEAYAAAHKDELADHVMAIEMDLGGFAPWGVEVDDGVGFGATATDDQTARQARGVARMADVVTLLAAIGADRAKPGHGGADISALGEAGVPALGLWTDDRTYFDYHHTEADTLDKVDPAALADDVAALAVIAYVVADMPGRLDDAPEAGADGGAAAAGGAG